jgi:hypothetical protein
MFIAHLALVSETARVSLSELTRVSAALPKQVVRDVIQYWDVQGTVDAFASLNDGPSRDTGRSLSGMDIGQDASGIHCDDTGQPVGQQIHFVAGSTRLVGMDLTRKTPKIRE